MVSVPPEGRAVAQLQISFLAVRLVEVQLRRLGRDCLTIGIFAYSGTIKQSRKLEGKRNKGVQISGCSLVKEEDGL